MSICLACLAPVAYAHSLPAGFSGFENPAACGACHKAIYEEWSGSMHAKSSKFGDPVHSAVYEAYAKTMTASGKTPGYFCASCHTPTADNIAALMKGEAMPDPSNPSNVRGATCSFCHKAEGLVEGERFSTYRFTEGIKGPDVDSKAPHGAVYSGFAATYKVCLGCHGFMTNSKGGVICSMNDEGVSDCLSCHMQEVDGVPASGSQKSRHFYHGIYGAHDPAMLKKGATVSLKVEAGKLLVVLENPNPHFFPSTNPLRVSFYKLEVFDATGKRLYANFEKDPSEDPKAMMVKLFKAGDKVGVPTWEAEGVAKDTRLTSKEERVVPYDMPAGAARATVKLFYRFAPPQAIEKFGIPADGTVEKPQLVSEAEIKL